MAKDRLQSRCTSFVTGAGLWTGGPRALPFLVLLLCGALLGACETTDGAAPPDTAAEGTAEASAESDVAALPPEPEPDIDDDPQQLMGLDRDALNEKLGLPALIRRDGDAEVWQYRADRCVLDLFLYGIEKKVEYIDLRDRGNGEDSVRDCFVGMLRAATPIMRAAVLVRSNECIFAVFSSEYSSVSSM